jgi:hypothetical protein
MFCVESVPVQAAGTLGNGVIMAVSAPAHALLQIVLVQKVAPIVTAELTALIGMHHHRILGLPAPDSQ